MKDVALFLVGFTLGITSFFLIVWKIPATSDIINIISIFVNIGIAVYVAYFIQNKLTNTRYVKDYLINLVKNSTEEYDCFLKNIRNSNLNRQEILKEFKYFSMKFTSLDRTLNKYLASNNSQLQSLNRALHVIITNSNEFNTTVTNSKVKLNFSTLDLLNNGHNNMTISITDLIFKINTK